MMPVMSGYEAARVIRALERTDAETVPIIALSANAFEEDIAMAKAAGMNEHLAKPVDINVMFKAMQKLRHVTVKFTAAGGADVQTGSSAPPVLAIRKTSGIKNQEGASYGFHRQTGFFSRTVKLQLHTVLLGI